MKLFSATQANPVPADHLLDCISQEVVAVRTHVLFQVLAVVFEQIGQANSHGAPETQKVDINESRLLETASAALETGFTGNCSSAGVFPGESQLMSPA